MLNSGNAKVSFKKTVREIKWYGGTGGWEKHVQRRKGLDSAILLWDGKKNKMCEFRSFLVWFVLREKDVLKNGRKSKFDLLWKEAMGKEPVVEETWKR